MFASRRHSLVICAALLLIAGCGKEEKKDAKIDTKGPPPSGGSTESQAPPAAGLKADVVLEAADWHAEWKKDEKAAREKYKGKVVELSGTVRDAGSDPHGFVGYVYLEAGKDIIGVRCATVDKQPWSKVSKGSQVKIRGKAPDFGLAGDLFECAIVEASPNPAIVITAAELAKEYLADRDAAKKKYQDKHLIVTGEVAEKKANDAGAVTVFLKGEGKVRVGLTYTAFDKEMSGQIQPGQKLKAIGQFEEFQSDDDLVALLFALTIKE